MLKTSEKNILLWYNKLWKIKGPLKGILFFWLVLKERVLKISYSNEANRGQDYVTCVTKLLRATIISFCNVCSLDRSGKR